MMLLENKYFRVLTVDRADDAHAVYHVALLADCDVYRGHFPHKPVSPGVCNIEMIRECASLLVGRRLLIDTIRQCRLTAVASPQACPRLDVAIAAEPKGDAWTVTASIADGATEYMTFKGELK